MAEQRSAFRFRLPWLPAGSTPRPTTPRPPAQSTAGTTPAPAPRRTAEMQVPPRPASTTTPTPAQSNANAIPAPAPRRTAETQVPPRPASTTTPTPTPQMVDTETPTKPTTITATSTKTAQTDEAQAPIQSTTTTIPSSTTPQKAEIEAPSPSLATKTPIPANTQTAQTQPPSQSTVPTTPTPANTQTAQTQPPSQPAATATATSITTERPPVRPPGVTSPQAPLTQPQASRTESQPSSPYHVTSQSQVPPQPASPSRATTQSQSSQPSTPSRAASQSRATSLLSSPSRTGSPNSPTTRTTSQPRSQSRTATRPAGQTSSTSPSSKAALGQPTTATLTESTSPSKRKPRLSPQLSQPSSNSTDPSSVLEKEPKSAVSEQKSLEQLQLKEETNSGMINDSQKQTPVETSTEPNEMAPQHLKESGMRTTTMFTPAGVPQTSAPAKKSDTPTRSSALESFPDDSKPEETKEVKEIMQETEKKTRKDARDEEDYPLTRVPGSAVQTKEQLPSFTFQSEQAQQTVDRKEIMATPALKGIETKTAGQPRNKTMSVESHQKLAMTKGEHIPLHKEIRDDISKLVQKMAAGDPKHSINDRQISVITLAGENRGATMHLGTDSMKKGGAVPIHRGYKVNRDESAETTTDGEGSFKLKSEDTKNIEDQTAESFANSNVQGINNSIIFNSSITERNPGVHLIHSCFPTKLKTSTAETELLETEKTEFSTSHAQKPTYEPMVRRRCLRGLFLESSDSDPENTTKPRHHGCRVGCNEKSKENKIDIY